MTIEFSHVEKIIQSVEKAKVADEHFFMTHTKPKIADARQWILNNDYSNYMTPKVEMFVELDTQHRSNVETSNGDFLQAISKGTVEIRILLGINSKEQFIDIITKSLSKLKFNYHRDKRGVLNASIKGER